MTRILVLGGSALTDPAVHALRDAGHAVSVYWSRVPTDQREATETLRSAVAGCEALVDLTHPFDVDVPAIAVALAPRVPRVRVGRPPWAPTLADRWRHVETLAQAVAALAPGARVFAASGRDSAEVLAHHDGPVFLRQLHVHADPAPDGCTYIFGDGPFDVDGEIALFQRLQIDAVLARNTGGAQGFPKIEAARALSLPVVLIAQPAGPFDQKVQDMDALLAWVRAL